MTTGWSLLQLQTIKRPRVWNNKFNHVHSIVKKKRLNDEKLEREYPEVWSDFSLEVVDKTLVNIFEGLWFFLCIDMGRKSVH